MSCSEISSNYEMYLTRITNGFTGLHFDNDQYSYMAQLRKEAMIGDMLEFQLGSHTHFALYLGNDKVMCIELEDIPVIDCACIRQRNLAEICDNGKARVQNHDKFARSLFNLGVKETQDIVDSVKAYEHRVVPFETDFRNSEYYCTLWRYGIGFSTQAAKLACNPTGSKSNWWNAMSTNGNYFVKDGYEKYKQLANSRHQALQISQW